MVVLRSVFSSVQKKSRRTQDVGVKTNGYGGGQGE